MIDTIFAHLDANPWTTTFLLLSALGIVLLLSMEGQFLRWARRRPRVSKRRIYVCSPFRGATREEEKENVAFAEQLCRDLTMAGAVAFAPHLFFTRFLDDAINIERNAGIENGLEIMALFDEVWFVLPGWRTAFSNGMLKEHDAAKKMNLDITVAMTPNEYAKKLKALRYDLMSDRHAKVTA